jgi:hypothetical protein
MNQSVSLPIIEILLSIVQYIVVISFVIMISQIIWTLFTIYREKLNINIEEDNEYDQSPNESE